MMMMMRNDNDDENDDNDEEDDGTDKRICVAYHILSSKLLCRSIRSEQVLATRLVQNKGKGDDARAHTCYLQAHASAIGHNGDEISSEGSD